MGDTKYFPDRQGLFYKGNELINDWYNLSQYSIEPNDTIYIKDRGEQIPLRLAKLIEYIGPPLIFRLYSVDHARMYETILGTDYIDNNRDIWAYQHTPSNNT